VHPAAKRAEIAAADQPPKKDDDNDGDNRRGDADYGEGR
jgi:hypothetical protein